MATKLRSSRADSFKVPVFLFLVIISTSSRICNSQRYKGAKKNIISIASIRCIVKDPSYISFPKCILKPVNRTLKLIDIYGELLKPFEKSVQAHFLILKRANGGFKPFGIDVTLDACKYSAGKRNIVYDWFNHLSISYTNLNHSCPFESEAIIKYPTNQLVFPSVFPEGEYLIEGQFSTYGVPRAALRAYITMKET